MMKEAAGGVWPTMITPFNEDGTIDFPTLDLLIEWYLDNRVAGLFAVCQSSESFRLDIRERLALAERVVEKADGRVPVIAGGNYSVGIESQAEEMNRMAATGVDGVVILTSQVAGPDEDGAVWQRNMERLLSRIPDDVSLGLYESPQPYHRLLSTEEIAWCVTADRFLFLKDTCCRLPLLKERLRAIRDSKLRLFNANAETLLASLQEGAAGYSSVMANVHPRLYDWLIRRYGEEPERARRLQSWLSVANSAMVSRCYPTSAKFYLTLENLPIRLHTRVDTRFAFDDRTENVIRDMHRLDAEYLAEYDD